jgi:thioredoxin-like negative regulator of GroEL/predicted aspartyl protease
MRLPACSLFFVSLIICAGFVGYGSAQQLASSAAPISATGPTTVQPVILDAINLYRRGDFDAAVEKYREILRTDAKNSDAFAGLTRTLLKQRKVDEARATLVKALPIADSPQLRIAAAEVDFREGSLSEAEREWAEVINSGHPDGRAYLGLAKVDSALMLYKRSQTMLQKAHSADPQDADIRKAWLSTLKRKERIKFLEEYLAEKNADDVEARVHMQQYLGYLKARNLAPTQSCHLVGSVTSTEAPLVNLLSDASHLRGYGLTVDFGGQKSKLMLDTGASGIVVDRRLADKVGLKQIAASTIGGIGDRGEVRGYVALAPSIKVGGLEFQDCPVQVIDRRSVVDEDGLIGADVFEKFLVGLDFAHQKLRLSELPKRPGEDNQNLDLSLESDVQNDGPENSATQASTPKQNGTSHDGGPYDRYIAPEMKNYSQVLRFGHALLIPTWVNDEKTSRFFLIDSGGFTTQLSLNAARSVTKVHDDPQMRVRGISGEVNKVYVADEATLVFARLRQPTQDIMVLNLKHLSDDVGFEVSGILGFTTLRFLNINIDYRDGLVSMEYQGPEWLVR